MKDVKFITCCPSNDYYTWQVHLWLESLRELNLSQNAIVLVYEPKLRPYNSKWDKIKELYPESEFIFYREKPEEDINLLISLYIPIIREYLMWTYFTDHPEEENKPVFFCDSDILFTKDFNISHLIENDINYVSDSVSYMGATYFDNKISEVSQDKLDAFKSKDVFQEILDCVGVSRETAVNNQEHSGGVQYLFKNCTAAFWAKVMNDSIVLRLKMQELNTLYFPNQDLGYQSWCSDMWGILWNLWHFNLPVKVTKELDFSWATDSIDIVNAKPIFHNAGITGEMMNNHLCFYKGKYHQGSDPTKDPTLNKIIESEESQKFGTWYYAKKLKELQLKYNINY